MIVNVSDPATMLAGEGVWGVDDGGRERSPVLDGWAEYFEQIGLKGAKLGEYPRDFVEKVISALKSVEFGTPEERGKNVKGTSLTDVVAECRMTATSLEQYLKKYR